MLLLNDVYVHMSVLFFACACTHIVDSLRVFESAVRGGGWCGSMRGVSLCLSFFPREELYEKTYLRSIEDVRICIALHRALTIRRHQRHRERRNDARPRR